MSPFSTYQREMRCSEVGRLEMILSGTVLGNIKFEIEQVNHGGRHMINKMISIETKKK